MQKHHMSELKTIHPTSNLLITSRQEVGPSALCWVDKQDPNPQLSFPFIVPFVAFLIVMYVNKLIEASVQKENGLNEVIVYYYDSWSPFKAVSTYTLFFPSLFLLFSTLVIMMFFSSKWEWFK